MKPNYIVEKGFDPDLFVLDCRGRVLDCRPGHELGGHVMGILNVTPDSFSDGGLYMGVEAALRRTEEMISEGAALVDVGGESSRPRGSVYGSGAEAVSLDAELARVVPVVERIATEFPEILISVDTHKGQVARAALEAGAHMINDITGLRFSSETAELAASFGAPMILMHSLGRPGEVPVEREDTDVVAEVRLFLERAVTRAAEAGIHHVVVDPGFGFGKTEAENLRLINHVERLLELGRPVLIGVSRKSTIGAVLGRPDAPVDVTRRLFGSLGATAVAVLRGAAIVRTHDVGPTVEFLRVLGAVVNSG